MNCVLEIQNLRVSFNVGTQRIVAVDGVSLAVSRGKTTAIVGESGCGKSVTALAITRLLPQPPARIESGRILLSTESTSGVGSPASDPVDVLRLGKRELRRVRGRQVAMVFQDPLASLNPVYTVGDQIMEAVEWHQGTSRDDARREALRLLDRVGINRPSDRLESYPHQLSGGMRQRTMIAIALACKPALLIADEPTTALDVTVQAQILDLLRELQRESGLTLLLITHDLGVVAEIAHHVYVMYAGRMVEHAPAEAILRKPLHPYTAALLACTPRLTAERGSFAFIPGQVPEPTHRPSGCAFHPRCELTVARAKAAPERSIHVLESVRTDKSTAVVLEHCVRDIPGRPSGVPTLNEVRPGRFVACWESECSSAVRDIDSFHGHCAGTENG